MSLSLSSAFSSLLSPLLSNAFLNAFCYSFTFYVIPRFCNLINVLKNVYFFQKSRAIFFLWSFHLCNWSSDCRLEVILAGKNFNFTLRSQIYECGIELCRNNFSTFLTHMLIKSLKPNFEKPDVIQAFLLTWYSIGSASLLTCLKQGWFNNFQVTNGVSLPPTLFAERDMIIFLLYYHHCIVDLFDIKFCSQLSQPVVSLSHPY